jgi:hypothetical protein
LHSFHAASKLTALDFRKGNWSECSLPGIMSATWLQRL